MFKSESLPFLKFIIMNQGKLFELEPVNDWQKEWNGMPEYNNELNKPLITVTIKFESQKDYDKFHSLLKEKIYGGKRVFDGNQSKTEKNTWFPLKPRPSERVYIREEFPFKEGETYYTIENYQLIKSTWDSQSEELHNEEKIYFDSEEFAQKIILRLRELEISTKRNSMLNRISGGFAIAEIKRMTDEIIYIDIKSGVQSDCEDHTNIESVLLDKKTLEIISNE